MADPRGVDVLVIGGGVTGAGIALESGIRALAAPTGNAGGLWPVRQQHIV